MSLQLLVIVFATSLAISEANVVRQSVGMCLYQGQSYQQGQKWTKGCELKCECIDASRGYYKCSSICPIYNNVPKDCKLVPIPGQCCSKPQCSFTSTGTQFTGNGGSHGTGTITGTGTTGTGVAAPNHSPRKNTRVFWV